MAFQVGRTRCVPDLPHSSGLLSSFKQMNEDMSWFNDTLHNEAMKTEKQHFSRETQNSLCIGERISFADKILSVHNSYMCSP